MLYKNYIIVNKKNSIVKNYTGLLYYILFNFNIDFFIFNYLLKHISALLLLHYII
jgi:hypothetical protein